MICFTVFLLFSRVSFVFYNLVIQCATESSHGFLMFFISPESRDFLGLYCRAFIVYNIMPLTLILAPLCSCFLNISPCR